MNISQPLKYPFDDQTNGIPSAQQETWYLKLNDPQSLLGLALEWDTLKSRNGFKRIAETRAIFFQPNSKRDLRKVVIQQSSDIQAFVRVPENDSIQMGECILTPELTQGVIHSKGQSIEWKLNYQSAGPGQFNLVPEFLAKTGLSRHTMITPYEDLIFDGTIQVNGETFQFEGAHGMLGRSLCPKNWHSWVWSHSNLFRDEQGQMTDFVFEGLSARSQLGPVFLPRFSTFYFRYQGKEYSFNHLRNVVHLKSKNTLNEWKFEADRDDLSFRGHLKAEHKDFAGLSSEDTNGSILYSAFSLSSDLKILVYRRGKLEATFTSDGTTGFQVVSRQKNPYVPLLV